MLINKRTSLAERLQPFCLQVKPYADLQNRNPRLKINTELFNYQESCLLQSRQMDVLNYYLALSIETLRDGSNNFKNNKDVKYDRAISGQEELVRRFLDQNYSHFYVRQLLIGGSHSDFYIPRIHIGIEPSSERFFATSRRSKSEDSTDRERAEMNHLYNLRIESYKGKDLLSIMQGLLLERGTSDSAIIQKNMYSMAIRTLPLFIPYKKLISLMEQKNENKKIEIFQ
jgi:hypothetical protein